ncbi:MAG: glycine cleavage system protein GcvH [Candidatus Omnitrophica bacterium]|nr:glycine cleavage system protein GcvH [Candidatus Omnitrophota bacterium]MDD5771514.1 glycine cleavage system protein GcvH [Candidatus Omnitrophota bacterium]
MNIPDNLLYTKDHEWAKLEGDKATMGITDFAQHSLGDITFIDLPKPSVKVKQAEWCATVESVKAASDVYAPFSGEILEVNTELNSHPELANKSPYESGWFAVIKISEASEKDKLMSPAKYKEYIEGLSK